MNDAVLGETTEYYFAYGSNMSREVLCGRRGITPVSCRTAVLEGWRMVFEHPGFPFIEPVFATLSQAPGEQTPGVLYELRADDVTRLHRSEGHNYRRTDVRIQDGDRGPIRAFTYLSVRRIQGRRPSRRYLDLVVAGAREHALPAEYIEKLRRTPALHIPLVASAVNALFVMLTRLASRGAKINLFGFKLGVRDRDPG